MTEQQRIDEFKQITRGIFTEKQVDKLQEMGYFTVPAALSRHGNEEGDLYQHSKLIWLALREFTEKLYLKWEAVRSPVVVAFLHDLCKTDDYVLRDGEFVWNKEMILNGHGDKSAIMALQLFPDLTDEEVMCIRYHMGAYTGQQEWKELGNAIRKYPNILWLHQADMITSQIWNI